MSGRAFGPGRCTPMSTGQPLLRHRIELGSGSVADDELGAPMACISELRYPDTEVDTAGTALALAGGGCLSTWQGERL